jgi:DNA-directed RNA polymerase subunit RPC12/RpoP
VTTAYVTCPRCHFRMSVWLHQITSTDEQACPRCEATDDISIPMLLMPEHPDGEEREVSASPDRGKS